MTRVQVDRLAAAIMSAVAPLIAVYAGPLLASQSGIAQIVITTLASMFGYYSLFRLAQVCLNWYRFRGILGTWEYLTLPYDGSHVRSGGYARMAFLVNEGGELAYKVDLFRSYEALVKSRKLWWQFRKGTSPADASGVATSDAIAIDPKDGTIRILYHVIYFGDGADNAERYGRLFLSRTGTDSMNGHWVSDVDKTKISSGRMIAARTRRFDSVHAAQLGVDIGNSIAAGAVPS